MPPQDLYRETIALTRAVAPQHHLPVIHATVTVIHRSGFTLPAELCLMVGLMVGLVD